MASVREVPMATIELRTPAFNDHGPIPDRHAKGHGDRSPALEWSGVPEGTAELAILCEDPDAPGGTFTHWVLAGLDPALTGLAEGTVPKGAVEGRNDYGGIGYGGPQPPKGDPAHRYFFRVFAASAPLGLRRGCSADDLRRALEGKELASGVVVGIYQR
jgi:Raf kinase inhibitor-like YbhB/YbcL family protein